ncbi:MAG: hypothetical protein QOE03_2163 [Micromonosporaceae bacterium]|nr:hypothetical protein [Micromonosporaceae bacterium]
MDEHAAIALVSLEELHGYLPEAYVGLVLATGSSAFEATHALEERAQHLTRRNQAHRAAAGHQASSTHAYAVLGVRLTAGISPSGQPEWVAYGTLARGRRHEQSPP